MLFWVIAGILTIFCVALTLFPLARHSAQAPRAVKFDLEVYKDQLAEIDRDETANQISAADAETARAEISRRILKLGAERALESPPSRAREFSALAVAALLPIVSWGLYSFIGSPDFPDQPLAARSLPSDERDNVESLIAKAEAHLRASPDDGRGWDVLAPIYSRLGRYPDAVHAYSRSLALNGPSAERYAGFGEALSGAAGGKVTADARAAFNQAITIQPGEPKAHLFLAIDLAQQGKTGEARQTLEAQLAIAPKDAPWRGVYQNALASLGAPEEAGKIGSGPSQADIDAASALSSKDRLAMIEGMVAGLAERLKTSPDDIGNWQKLIRSYIVLNRMDDASKAFEDAQGAFKGDPEKLGVIRDFAKNLGLNAS